MPFINPGNNVTNRITFNSGTLDFGNSRIVQIENLTLTVQYSITGLYVLGSIKPQDQVHHTQKVMLSGQMKSYAPEQDMMAWGSSTLGATNQVNTLDGQPTQTSPVLTMFDRNNKQIQYQLSGAVFKSTKASAKMEEYTTFDFELEALDIVAVYTP